MCFEFDFEHFRSVQRLRPPILDRWIDPGTAGTGPIGVGHFGILTADSSDGHTGRARARREASVRRFFWILQSRAIDPRFGVATEFPNSNHFAEVAGWTSQNVSPRELPHALAIRERTWRQLRCRQIQKLSAQAQGIGALSISEETVVAYSLKAIRQNVQQQPS